MIVSKEANIHYYAKLALAKMLDMYHEGDNCFHVIEYPIIESLDYQAFDEHYSIRKSDNAVVYPKGFDKDKHAHIHRIYSSHIASNCWLCYPKEEYYKELGHEFRFSNLDMPTLKNYIDGGVKVKYFVDVAQIWKGTLRSCFEIKNRNPVDSDKINYLSKLASNVFEIPSRHIMSYDHKRPDLRKLAENLSEKYWHVLERYDEYSRFHKRTA
jgi:hypothetical protein|tara:strand:- start:54 stop:689 length:636 start_codon:yes stop_codon:yes gene_type:complete